MSVDAARVNFDFQSFKQDTAKLSKRDNIFSADRMLKKNVEGFKNSEQQKGRWQKIASAIWLIPLIGWIISGIAYYKIKKLDQKNDEMIKKIFEQIAKDLNRDFVIELNDKKYETVADLKKAWEGLESDPVTKFTMLQMMQQGLFATILLSCYNELMNLGQEKAPPVRSPEGSLQIGGDGVSESYQLLRDITRERKVLSFFSSETCTTLSSGIETGLVLLNTEKPAEKRKKIGVEFQTQFQIELNTGALSLNQRAVRVNPDLNADPTQRELAIFNNTIQEH